MSEEALFFGVVSDEQRENALASALAEAGLTFKTQKDLDVDSVLAQSPQAILVDEANLKKLTSEIHDRLSQSGTELILVHDESNVVDEISDDRVSDVVELPINNKIFHRQMQRVLESSQLRREISRLKDRLDQDGDQYASMIGERTDERNQAENTAHQLSSRLVDLDRLKSNLITIISHEFKTPIHLASGYASLLADESGGALNDEQKAAVEVIERQLERLKNKLQDIERVAQLEMGLTDEMTESIDVAVVLEHEIDGFKDGIRGQGLELSVDLAHDLPAIRGNQDFLADIFRRLIDNAIHYNSKNGRVSVRASSCVENEVSGILIEVEDTGQGVAPALLPHIFERFGEFRDIEHHSSRQSGLGLGLAICRHLVELHGGTISVLSEVGKGSIFRVILPVER